ncbi:MAG: pyridoxal phosphate-dependent aminotransferase [Planctomycetota bacterium]
MRFAERMSRLGTETAFEVLARAKALEAQGRSICHLEIGEPDFATPEFVVAAGQEALEQGLTKYGPAAGSQELREAIAADVSRRRNVTVDPAEVVIVPGAKPILFFALLALVEEGDEVLVPDPGFPIYSSVVAMAGGVPVPYRLDPARGFDIDTNSLRRARGGIFNTPHNPTGGVIDPAAWNAVAELDLDWVVSDEVYSRMVYEGAHASALSVPSLRDRTVLVDGFSKTWSMTGWRIGFGVMPPELAEKVTRLQINCTSCVPAFTQRAALAALTGPEDPVREMVAAFRGRRDRITEGLRALPGVECATPKGAFYVFPDVSALGDSDEIAAALLEEEGVACLSGTAFGDAGKGFLRFSYAASSETIDDALGRIANFLSRRA